MKMLFTSMDRMAVGILRGIIEEAGIELEVRNDATSANYPTGPFFPELWIIYDEDFARAVELRDAWRATPSAELTPWTCPSCGETLEAQFSSCWKCGVVRGENTK
jgi:hypothetical protein